MIHGSKVKQARLDKKLTQAELAEMVSATRQTISLIEAGKYNPSLKLCIDIAIALDRTLNDLFWFGEQMGSILHYPHILITDIGSTTTKALLLAQEDGHFHFLDECSVPTTVEHPREDVKIGVIAAARQLSQSSGVKLVSDAGKLKVPFLTTSSAGGGLQMMVFGLSSHETGRVAEMTAYGAGGIILRTFTVDDGFPPIHKMRLIRDLHPDLILMAGGIDNGNIAGIVRLAELLKLAQPVPKFQPEARIPLIYCGNTRARPFVQDILDDTFELHVTDNIRPNLQEMNLDPAREKIHEQFMDTVMERAPGYTELKRWVKKAILPTPSGVEKILSLYGTRLNKNVVMVDMGGATTDIFSNIYGEYNRTVAANIGMSYSICNILAQAGIERILAHLPSSLSEDDVRDYVANKMLHPTYIPTDASEKQIEQAAAICGIDLAWQHHQEMNFKAARVGYLDQMRNREDFDPFEETFFGRDESAMFQVSDIDLIIGAGGVMSHAGSREAAFRMLVEGFQPSGVTKIAIDRSFKSPHLGVLSTLDAEVALNLFEQECVTDLGYVVAPTGPLDPNETVLTVIDNSGDMRYALKGGTVLYLPKGGHLTISPNGPARLFKNTTEIALETELPILFDCRGRGQNATGRALASYGVVEFQPPPLSLTTPLPQPDHDRRSGPYRFWRELPYKGEIFVKPGDVVQPDTVVAENRFTPPRIYMIDIRNLVGYDHKLSADDIKNGLLVKVGQTINSGQKIFKRSGTLGDTFYYASVRGEIIRIEPGGLIVLREIQDYNDKPHVVDAAQFLGVKPKHLKAYLRVEVGDFVQREQVLSRGDARRFPLKSPATGTVKSIDTNAGTITIQYDAQPVPLQAFVAGNVVNIREELAVEIAGEGTILQGLIGFGPERFGPLTLMDGNAPKSMARGQVIVCRQTLSAASLVDAAKAEVAGIIAPAIHLREWVEFVGNELGVAVTGDENISFTLILTEGFGDLEMNSDYWQFFEAQAGQMASLSGRTQIRAGVIRPLIVVSENAKQGITTLPATESH